MVDLKAKEQEIAKKQSRTFRRKWIPAIKTILSSAGDIAGDWTFYAISRRNLDLKEYGIPLFIFCIVSSIFGVLTVSSVLWKNCSPKDKRSKLESEWLNVLNMMLATEIILEE